VKHFKIFTLPPTENVPACSQGFHQDAKHCPFPCDLQISEYPAMHVMEGDKPHCGQPSLLDHVTCTILVPTKNHYQTVDSEWMKNYRSHKFTGYGSSPGTSLCITFVPMEWLPHHPWGISLTASITLSSTLFLEQDSFQWTSYI